MTQLPEKIQGFLKEYKALCDKWGCFVSSDGSSASVVEDEDPSDDNYWEIDEGTLYGWKRLQEWKKRQEERKL